MFGYLKHIHIISVCCFIIMVAVGCFHVGHADGANGNEAKIASPGGYNRLFLKSQETGFVRIIVKVRAPFTPEPRLRQTEMQLQRDKTKHIQDHIITEIERKGHKPRSIRKYKYTPHIAMTVDSATLDALISSPDVISVEEDIPVPPLLDSSVPRIGATQLHENSVTGSGWAVAVLDTGVDKAHPFLQDSVVSEACYSTNDSGYGSSSLCPEGVEASILEGSAMPYSQNCPTGECDHGSHVAGIVAGRSGIIGSPGAGVAPEAGIIAIQVFSRFASLKYCGSSQPCILSFTSDQMAGLERVYELRNVYSIASVNMSLGGGYHPSNCDENSLKATIDNLREAGIATVIASGNDGLCGYMAAPACISSAISVGATYDDDTVALFSNRASFLSILAPGQRITSSVPGGGYAEWAGTSMATPHVSGAWALIKQANPVATVDEILSSFTSTGLSVTDQYCSSVTKKRVNVYETNSLLKGFANLAVSKIGVGTGTVTSDLSDIDCGETCSFWFARDTVVTLSATADAGSAFGGWSGGVCIGTDPCIVNVSAGTSVTALFRKEVTIGTKITITGTNFGSRKGKVLIGDVSIKIDKYGWFDNVITCTVNRVPRASPGIFPLTIKPRGAASIILDGAIDVKNPKIDSLSIDHGFPGAKITINGKFFGSRKQRPYLEYQGKTRRCKIDSWAFDSNNGDSEIVFIVPNRLTVRKYQLNVNNRIGTVSAGYFTIDPLPLP